jgi:dTDP-4-dehydrorhamnose reductase
MINVLILGSSGQLGSQFESTKKINFIKLNKQKCDINNYNLLKKTLKKFKLNFIINCAAFTNVDLAEKDLSGCYNVNVSGIFNIIECIKKTKIKLIHISTDYVFNGEKEGYYSENDFCDPINVYGRSKFFAEKIIINSNIVDRAVILRTSWVYSDRLNSFVGKILANLLKNKKIKVADDNYGTPTSVMNIVESIKSIILNKKYYPGTYNIVDGIKISRYQFAKKIFLHLKYYKFNTQNLSLSPTSLKKVKGTHAKRPLNRAIEPHF